MKKKNWFNELILAVIFIAATASAQKITYVYGIRDIQPPMYECLVFDLDVNFLRGTEVTDELGSKHVRLDWVNQKIKRIVYMRENGQFCKSYEARVNANGKNMNGVSTTHHAVMVMNTFEGETDGYVSFTFSIPKDDFTPALNLYLSGKTTNKWNDYYKRWMLVNGSGVVSGQSYSTTWSAWADLKPATPDIISQVAPVWGTFKVNREMLPEDEIVSILKK